MPINFLNDNIYFFISNSKSRFFLKTTQLRFKFYTFILSEKYCATEHKIVIFQKTKKKSNNDDDKKILFFQMFFCSMNPNQEKK